MAEGKSVLREYVEAIVVAVLLAGFIIAFIAQSFLVQGASMEPSLTHGERLLVDKVTYRFREPERGEIVVFRYPADRSRKFIKRVIGRPGDVIYIRGGRVFLNGTPLREDYILGPTYGDFPPMRVPPDHYFVLGDNRNNSDDSRFSDVGPVPRQLLVGRAIFVYWPLSEAGIVTPPSIFQGHQ